MSKIEALNSKAADSADWNHAWSVVAQLAAARSTTLRELGPDERGAALRGAAIDAKTADAKTADAKPGSDSAAEPAAPFPPIAPDQLARDIAEIERAAAALRRAEPTLERHAPEAPTGFEPRISHSIWPLVCVIWLTAAAVVSGAIGALVLLIG
jgi:hypothetical protein